MKTVLLTNRYSGTPLEIVKEEFPAGFRMLLLERQDESTLADQIAEADYLLAGGRMRITKTCLEHAGKLKMIQRSGAGLDSLDLRAIQERGIPLYVNQGVNTESVAEHTLLLILASLRKLTLIHQNTVNGIWRKQEQGVQTAELKGKTVGIIGMGNSGQALARLLQPFQVRILYTSRTRKDDAEKVYDLHFVPLGQLLHESDVVSLNCSLNADNAGMIGEQAISQMKPGAVLVNTARGGLVVTESLARALECGKLSFAGIDVYDTEPIPEDYPLKKLRNVILTPHIAGITGCSFRMMMHDAFRNIAFFEHGRLQEIEAFRYL